MMGCIQWLHEQKASHANTQTPLHPLENNSRRWKDLLNTMGCVLHGNGAELPKIRQRNLLQEEICWCKLLISGNLRAAPYYTVYTAQKGLWTLWRGFPGSAQWEIKFGCMIYLLLRQPVATGLWFKVIYLGLPYSKNEIPDTNIVELFFAKAVELLLTAIFWICPGNI